MKLFELTHYIAKQKNVITNSNLLSDFFFFFSFFSFDSIMILTQWFYLPWWNLRGQTTNCCLFVYFINIFHLLLLLLFFHSSFLRNVLIVGMLFLLYFVTYFEIELILVERYKSDWVATRGRITNLINISSLEPSRWWEKFLRKWI